MGANHSSESDTTKHIFTSSQPINFSPELIDSLASTSETNSTRAKTLDLHIQQRVSEELAKILNQEDSRLAEARKRIEQQSSTQSSDADGSSDSSRLKDLVNISPADLLTGSSGSKEEQERKRQTSQKVQDEIEKLKQQLSQRKVLKDLPKEVEQARDGVISCLRLNDRRPLDCWKEVELFKREVGKLEDEFVKKVL